MNFIKHFMEHYNVQTLHPSFVEAVNNTPTVKADINRVLGIPEDKQETVLLTVEEPSVTLTDVYDVACKFIDLAECVDIDVNDVETQHIHSNTLPSGAKFSRTLLRAYRSSEDSQARRDFTLRLRESLADLKEWSGQVNGKLDTVEQMVQTFYDIIGTSKKVYVYVTSRADDFFGLSENCSWASCVNAGGAYDGSCSAWMRHDRTAIVYGTTSETSRKKFFRLLLHVNAFTGKFALGRVYGNVGQDVITTIRQTIQKRIEKNLKLSDGKWRFTNAPGHTVSEDHEGGDCPYRDTLSTGSVWINNTQISDNSEEDEDVAAKSAKRFDLGYVTTSMCIRCGRTGAARAVCEECLREYRCDSCGDIFTGQASELPNGVRVCRRCYNEQVFGESGWLSIGMYVMLKPFDECSSTTAVHLSEDMQEFFDENRVYTVNHINSQGFTVEGVPYYLAPQWVAHIMAG